eukprot:3941266-Rhodomonas_salina.7
MARPEQAEDGRRSLYLRASPSRRSLPPYAADTSYCPTPPILISRMPRAGLEQFTPIFEYHGYTTRSDVEGLDAAQLPVRAVLWPSCARKFLDLPMRLLRHVRYWPSIATCGTGLVLLRHVWYQPSIWCETGFYLPMTSPILLARLKKLIAGTVLRASYALSGTDLQYAATTTVGHSHRASYRCLVLRHTQLLPELTWSMLLPGDNKEIKEQYAIADRATIKQAFLARYRPYKSAMRCWVPRVGFCGQLYYAVKSNAGNRARDTSKRCPVLTWRLAIVLRGGYAMPGTYTVRPRTTATPSMMRNLRYHFPIVLCCSYIRWFGDSSSCCMRCFGTDAHDSSKSSCRVTMLLACYALTAMFCTGFGYASTVLCTDLCYDAPRNFGANTL